MASQFPMPEMTAATRLTDLLYRELVNGTSLRIAVQRVRKALRVRPWTQPALFPRGRARCACSRRDNTAAEQEPGGGVPVAEQVSGTEPADNTTSWG